MAPKYPRLATITTALLLALAYFATGRLGLMLPAFGSNITLIWLPTGLAVAALLRWGFGCWPGIALGALAVNLAVGSSWPVALGIAVGNTLGPLLAAGALQRMKFHPAFDRSRDILLLAAAAALGMLVTSSLGVATLTVFGLLPAGARGQAWLSWWAGDALGVIAAAPLVLTVTQVEVRAILRRRVEFLSWLVATCLTTWAAFLLNRGGPGQALAIAFTPLPFVAWAALRFGPVGTSLGLILVAVGAAYGTATQTGPFYRSDPVEEVVLLWLFMLTSAVLGWLISAVNTARRQSVGVQRLFEQALTDVSLGVLLAGLDRRTTYANHGFTQLTGYPEAEMLGKSCALLQGPETDPQVVARLKAALQGDGFFDGEILNYRKDGTTFWNGLLISPVRDAGGAMTGFLGIQRDVTKRKQAEFALSQSEEHLRTIIELEPECVKIVSPEGKLLEMNPAGLAMIEACTLEEVRGLPVSELIVPEDRAAFAEMNRRVLQGATGRCEFAIVGIKGARRCLETHAVPYRNGQREIIGILGITRDITERKRAEEALRRSEVQFRTLADHLPDVVARFDRDRRHLYINPAAESATGLKPEAFAGKTNEELGMPPENTAIWKAALERVFAKGADERLEFSYSGPSGKAFWESQIVAERGSNGSVESALVVSRDITGRKQADEALHTAAEFTKSLIGSMQDGFSVLDADGVQSDVNPAFCRMTGFSREALIGSRPPYPYWPPEEHERIQAALSATMNGRVADFELTFMRQDGERFPVIVSPSAVRNQDGTVRSYCATVKDITERKRAEEERTELLHSLEESQVRLQTLVSNLPGMAYRCVNDPNWTMSYVSEGCEAVTGYRRDELENNRAVAYAELIHGDDRDWLWTKCQASLDARIPCQNEYRIIDKHGRERWVGERASGVYAADGALLAIDGFIQDITAARQARIERELLDRKMQETQKLESLGVLAGGIAHDFNNLLTAILGNASIAQLELPPGSSVQDCLEHITEASLRAADLCKQMLAYSGRGRFVVQTLDLGELVEQTAQMLQISISKKAVLRYRLEKGLPTVEVDATQMRQVIMNLVINASEAIGDASGVISISTGLTRVDRHYLHGTLMDPDLPEGDYVFLEVSDSGCGMSAETQARIFDPFFTTKFTGRGLGLAAVLGIVRGHKGAMKVYSEAGRGTTFKLLFPAAAGVSQTLTPAQPAAEQWHGEGSVLVVDDEETMRSTIARMMRMMGLEPVLAVDGRAAVEIFRENPGRFVFVLLDLTMPHMDGEQTFTELRRLRPEVRVVLMSGFNAQEALVRFSGKGLANFLQKPFTIDALRTIVQGVLS